jgi:gluconolactonase
MKIRVIIISLIAVINIYSQSHNIFPSDATPMKLFDGGYFTEGPAYGADGCIYFSDQTFTSETDMTAGIIWKYDSVKDTTIVFRSPSGMANGISFDQNGNMIVCEGADFGGRMIIRTDMKTGKSKIIAGLYNDKPFNSPNDLVIDKQGRIYFTDPRYTGRETIDQPVMGVYRIDRDSKIKLIISAIPMPNGIAISPDGGSLYVGCNFEGGDNIKPLTAIYKYGIENGDIVKFDKILVEFNADSGPDGIKTDLRGNLFVAVRDEHNPKIKVYNSEGREIDSLALPEVPSNLTFSPDYREIYITAGKGLYRMEVIK